MSIVFAILSFITANEVPALPLPTGELDTELSANSSVATAYTHRSLVWADFVTADGIIGAQDGAGLFAGEENARITELTATGQQHTYLASPDGPASLAAHEWLLAVQYTSAAPFNSKPPVCDEVTNLSAEGRLEGDIYVTANTGIHMLSEWHERPGLIPDPRRSVTVAFSGSDKDILYVPQKSTIDASDKTCATPEHIRNTAMAMHTSPMLTSGFAGRPR